MLEVTENQVFGERKETEAVATLLLDVVPFAMRELRRELRSCRDHSLTIPQFRILAHLACEPANNKTLAEALGVSVPAMSRMVKFLVQRRLVERTQGLLDKREVSVRLTKNGIRQFQLVKDAVRDALSQRMLGVSAEKLSRAETGLAAVRSILAEISLAGDRMRH